jgi:hypothetical protein
MPLIQRKKRAPIYEFKIRTLMHKLNFLSPHKQNK